MVGCCNCGVFVRCGVGIIPESGFVFGFGFMWFCIFRGAGVDLVGLCYFGVGLVLFWWV